jgi:DNA-binding IclR family transcriptional regulator
MMELPARTAVKSADRVLDLFELLARRGGGMSHAEISDALGIPKSSLTQLIRNLCERGYLAYAPATKEYGLGGKFSELARRTSLRHDLVGMAEPLLDEITRATGESSAFNLLEGHHAKVVATANGQHRLVSHMRLGDLAPLHATSGGKAMLAFFSDAMLDEYLAAVPLKAITPRTITSAAKLRAQLREVRAGRIADVFEEFTPGIVGIAVPIVSAAEEPLGAFNVALPAVRYGPEVRGTVIAALQHAAEVLHRRLAEQ